MPRSRSWLMPAVLGGLALLLVLSIAGSLRLTGRMGRLPTKSYGPAPAP